MKEPFSNYDFLSPVMSPPRSIALFFFFIFSSLLFFSKSLHFDFVWDDQDFLLKNPFIQSWHGWKELFTNPLAFASQSEAQIYRPLRNHYFFPRISVFWNEAPPVPPGECPPPRIERRFSLPTSPGPLFLLERYEPFLVPGFFTSPAPNRIGLLGQIAR